MPELPRLRVSWNSQNPNEEVICRFEEAEEVVFGQGLDVLIFVEGQMVGSYEELTKLAAGDRFKNKEMLNVRLVSVVAGG